ncbi:MAG: AAA+ family ATPase, partial [Thermoanaerobaculia bacterium]|nr:AAA+ family ATPase [Thermoanaerobaculia bacterium]
MALTNQERVGKAMDHLRAGLAPFVERELRNAHADRARAEALKLVGEEPNVAKRPLADWDVAALLKVMRGAWTDVFGRVLGRAERTLVHELGDWRNDWAHQKALSSDDADRALDSMARLLTAISAPEADEVARMKLELRRLVYDEQVRSEKRKAGGSLIDVAASGTLKPWREVVTPHADVASGGYQQAEFAADLWQVHLGEGTPEYRDPTEFFRRTYLTESLRALLVNGIRRIYGKGGDPVVQLQTNFGGGKTHSMLALYHPLSGISAKSLPGVEAVSSTHLRAHEHRHDILCRHLIEK